MSEVHEMKSLTLEDETFNSFPDQQARGDILKKLPLPDGAAKVGQYLRVLSVDEAGKITGLEATDASQNSGGNVDLTGYATEEWVQDGYQPKGEYLTEVPDGYAKTEDIPTIPDSLKNPNSLTFTGAEEVTYDGSKAVTVTIPKDGGGISVAGANVGQIVKISAVDEKGVPTAWEAADFPSGDSGGWELICEAVSDGAGDAVGLYIPVDFTKYREIYVEVLTAAGQQIRVVLSSVLAWYNGTIVATNLYGGQPTSAPAMIHCIIKNIDGTLYPWYGFQCNNSNIQQALTPMFGPATNLPQETPKYIRADANNAVVPEGVTLKAYGRK